jgi:hypothetical protein
MNNLQLALQNAERIEQMLIESGGEITPEIQNEMILNPATISELVDIKYVSMERMDSSIEFFEKKAEEFKRIAHSLKSAQKFILDSIKNHMIETGKKELVGNEYQFKLSTAAPKVMIVDEEKIAEAYKKQVTETQIDKKLIAEDLKKGIPVDGCVLEEVYAIRKSIVKGTK